MKVSLIFQLFTLWCAVFGDQIGWNRLSNTITSGNRLRTRHLRNANGDHLEAIWQKYRNVLPRKNSVLARNFVKTVKNNKNRRSRAVKYY